LVGDPAYGGFQLYSIVKDITIALIPDTIPYEQAVVLPLAISTAAAGLYEKGFLELPYPTVNPKPIGKTILVWGGSSSVGSTTIQLAIASGLDVISTASKRNFEYVKALGAKHVFDHSSTTVVEDILAVLSGSEFVGAYDAISSSETLKATVEIVHRLGGGLIATVLAPPEEGLPSDVRAVGGGESKILSVNLAS
jgi:NADPH:quinone reductase-like Zn-dependent oxidoreductase